MIDYQAKHKSITQERIEEAIESDIYNKSMVVDKCVQKF